MKLSQALSRAKETEQNVSGVVTDPRQYPMALHEAVVALQDLIGAVEQSKISEYTIIDRGTGKPVQVRGVLYFDAEGE